MNQPITQKGEQRNEWYTASPLLAAAKRRGGPQKTAHQTHGNNFVSS